MIITDTLRASGWVDKLGAPSPEAIEALARKLGKSVQASGEDIGAFIRQESVYFTRRDISDFREELIGEWAPNPAEGVELVGGALDGEVLPLERADGPLPPLRWRFPIPGPAQFEPTTVGPVFPNHVAEYERLGIDSERDRWVYKSLG